MNKRLVRPASAEAALKAVELAFEAEWENLSEAEISLPDDMSDAIACMARGRELLATGLRFQSVEEDLRPADDEEYRMVARNGGVIPAAVQERMRQERSVVESQLTLDIDGEK